MYQVFDAAANRWRAYAYVATEAANSGVQTHRPVGPAADGGPCVDEPRHELAAHAVRLEHRLRDERRAAGVAARAVRRRQQLERRLLARLQSREPASPQLVGSAPSTRYMHDSTSLVVTGRTRGASARRSTIRARCSSTSTSIRSSSGTSRTSWRPCCSARRRIRTTATFTRAGRRRTACTSSFTTSSRRFSSASRRRSTR